MKLQQYRKAFSLVTALVIIVLMASIAMLVFNLSGKMVKGTTVQYNREQAVLLAKSYTEYAVMAITANDRINTNCLQDIDSNNIIRAETNGGYQARVRISYIGSVDDTLTGLSNCDGVRVFSNTVNTPETPLSAVIDVYIEYKDMDHHETDFNQRPWITYHKRTLQKI